MMKAEEFLQKIKKYDIAIDASLEELAKLETLATKTTSVLGGECVQTSGSKQKMADTVAKIVELKNKINDDIDRFIDYKAEAREVVLRACDADSMQLIFKKYFGIYDKEKDRVIYATWEDIARELGVTYQWIARSLRSKALNQVQMELDKKGEK